MADLESELVERKESLTETPAKKDGPIEKIRQAVCAFANDLPGHRRPGVVFVGVRDDGTPSGIEVTDRLLQRLADIKTDGNTLPPPAMSVTKRTLAGCDVAVVTVEPADAPPVRARGRIWIRVGPRRAIADAQVVGLLILGIRPQDFIPSRTFSSCASRAPSSRVTYWTRHDARARSPANSPASTTNSRPTTGPPSTSRPPGARCVALPIRQRRYGRSHTTRSCTEPMRRPIYRSASAGLTTASRS